MWDLKLLFLSYLHDMALFSKSFYFNILNLFDPLLLNGYSFLNIKGYYEFSQNVVFFFGIKFLLAIGFLILIRGGTPRYRYDYLTKLGWLKFLGLVVLAFFSSLLTFFVF